MRGSFSSGNPPLRRTLPSLSLAGEDTCSPPERFRSDADSVGGPSNLSSVGPLSRDSLTVNESLSSCVGSIAMLLAWLRRAAARANHGGASPDAARSASGGRVECRLGLGLGRNSKLPSSSSSEFSAVRGSLSPVDTRRLATPRARVAAFDDDDAAAAAKPAGGSRLIWMGLPGVLCFLSSALPPSAASFSRVSRATRGPPSLVTTALTSAARAALACSL